MRKSAGLVLLALAKPAAAQHTNVPGRDGHIVRGPSLALAIEAAQTAIDTCKASGYLVGVTVMDDDGGIRVALTADGAPTEGPNGSRRTTLLAAKMKASSAEIAERMKTDATLSAHIEANKDYTARGGAILIKVDGKIVGAIGVEGNPHDQPLNAACAQAGVDRIQSRLK